MGAEGVVNSSGLFMGHSRASRPFLPVLVVILTIFLIASCGSATSELPDLELTPAGQSGLETMRTLGCGSCHGANGQGVDGLGPALQSLLGSQVTLSDGSVIVVDADYLRLSITDPGAQIVQGYGLPMPPYRLDPAEMDSLLALFEEL